MENIVTIVDWAFLLFYLCLNSSYSLLLFFSLIDIVMRNRRRIEVELDHSLESFYTIPVTIIAPAYNEEYTIEASIKSLLSLRYPEFEVIVVNDGSKDDTIGVMQRAFDLYPVHNIYQKQIETQKVRGIYKSRVDPRLVFVDKENGGKADALNCGVNIAKYPLFCAIDADTLILPNALLKVALPFMEDPVKTVASGGTIRVANGCKIRSGDIEAIGFPKNPVAAFQVVEYLRAFLFGRIGWNLFGGTLIISGAFGLFSRRVTIEIGGYAHDTVGEDMELVVRMHRYLREKKRPYRIVFVWDAACYTEVPEDIGVLGRQRNRWQRGLIDVMNRHKRMLFNHKYGVVGLLAYPFFAIFEMLGPIVEIVGIVFVVFSYILGLTDVTFLLLYLNVAVLFGIMLSISAILLEELSFRAYPRWRDITYMCLYAIVENMGYRHLTLIWRIKGLISYLRGSKQWGAMVRKGFGRTP
ncbi:MAG: glycosyltransferase family 2 protein [Deltaproteobacteria bacterium]|nr:glycosyltransferase family 2 protein [Deltaproteobacteria bacterium]